MLDFVRVSYRTSKRSVEVYPKFIIRKSDDLMIRGGDFYAVWVEERGLWSTDEDDVVNLIDRELDNYVEANKAELGDAVQVKYMWDAASGSIDAWHKYCQKQCRDNFNMLDETLVFSNTETNKKDFASKRLPYPLERCDIPAYEKLISTLYTEEERAKIEWAIGAIITGDSKNIQKFLVLYGAAGTGKSTILNIIQQLFEGYYSVFDAKALGSASNSFALEAFKSNPLVAIQHDGDLSKIEDNTRLNSLVSHELMTVNEKFKSTYANRFKAFLFMGTNKPVKITDGKSGLIRRLIDVTPSGNKVSPTEYATLVKQVSFELGGIAQHCKEVYLANPGRFDSYVPISMLGASNDFYNYILDSYHVFKRDDGTTLKAAWEMYKNYCEDAKVPYPFSQRNFKEELKNYFRDYSDRVNSEDGARVRSYYSGFRTDIFNADLDEPETETPTASFLKFESIESVFDKECAGCFAQYASVKETPTKKWDDVTTTLSEIDTSRLHYVKVPENHIVIDFDIPDEEGNKCLARNIAEASKWPATYAELSKSGQGVHLHYIYTGDVNALSGTYKDHVEIKVFSGKSSLRRKLTMCTAMAIATIGSGLPLKGVKKMVDFEGVKSEKALRSLIERNMNKEFHPGTKPSIDFIHKILEDTYNSGLHYDVTDMRAAVYAFASHSSHQAAYCIRLVNKMRFKSEEPSECVDREAPIAFYDCEVFPNLFIVNYKVRGEGQPVVRMINPSPSDIEDLLKYRLIGFNCRRYDNHMIYACLMGYTNEQLYNLSQKIVSGDRNAFFGEAYNLSYTDVYDFSSKKQSLKKFEIELGIHHQELGLPWDQPVPKERWKEVAEYCDNDVIATEAVFDARKSDWLARKILAKLAGMTVNDTTNSLTTRIIFGKNRNPQNVFNYRNMGDVAQIATRGGLINDSGMIFHNYGDEYTAFDEKGRPVFPGYKYELGVSTYRGEEIGEGGYVYAEPGMYGNVALLDIASMHPSSVVAENLFGDEYTKRFKDILDARIAIKHKDFAAARLMLNGALAEFLEDEGAAGDLAQALKIAINSVYGLTMAKFPNPFRDPRNLDNIVAKRGALFMVNLKHEVQKRGFAVAHIKTDSIKIPDATPEIIQFVFDYGRMYGYTFEHEATYERMCLVNNAVYIAKYKDGKNAGKWTPTGKQFAVPYVFKTLFSKEPIEFEDMCEKFEVKTALYLDTNETLPEGEHNYHFIGKVGNFCPIKDGCGGGVLARIGEDKAGNVTYDAPPGTLHSDKAKTPYKWLEAEMVKDLGKEGCIDRTYYDDMVDKAIETISEYGDFRWFVSDDPYISPVREEDDTPPWEGPDDPWREYPTYPQDG